MKRAFDFVAAGGLLVCLAPLMAAIALLVRWKMGAPVLFRQVRPGRDERRFTILKFRTMKPGFDAGGSELSDVQRLTALGRWLRATSLDELPELWNVFKGEMSLVGPRPLLPEYLDRYTPEQRRRHAVRPGITGWAQIHGRNVTTWKDRLERDLWYVDHQSLWLDLRILAITAVQVLQCRGIQSSAETTMEPFQGVDPEEASRSE